MTTAVKRLMKEAAELRDPTEHYHAQPLEVSRERERGVVRCFITQFLNYTPMYC